MTSSSDNLEDDNDDDFEDDDEEDDELPDLGDWRNFRNNLSERGLDVTTDSSSSSSSSSAATPSSSSATTSPPPVSSSSTDNNDDIIPYPEKKKRPRSVSKRNEELLMKQNSILGKEYINDVWAHATPDVSFFWISFGWVTMLIVTLCCFVFVVVDGGLLIRLRGNKA